MSTNEQVADFAAETYPSYSQELHHSYIEGYNPVSLAAPHSSLLRNSTWIGMGLLLGFFPFAGTLIWGISTGIWDAGTAANYSTILTTIGAIGVVVTLVGGFGSIHFGRRYYRKYVKETGRTS